MKSKTLFIRILVFSIFVLNCRTQQDDFPKLTGPYLGQKPPGMAPDIFAPGIVSLKGIHDFKGAFSIDGKEYYFCRRLPPDYKQALYFMKVDKKLWTEPAPLKITEGPRTGHPCITHDNKCLLFYWRFNQDQSQQSGYYASARTDTGWSAPQYAGQALVVTTDRSGSLYGNEIVNGSPPEFYLNKITFKDGLFTDHKRLYIDMHYGKQTHPCIAPDGSYIVFDIQHENSKLFVSFKDEKNQWEKAVDLTRYGLQEGARNASISPDGRYLFYGYKGDIWWVNAKIIEKLRPNQREKSN